MTMKVFILALCVIYCLAAQIIQTTARRGATDAKCVVTTGAVGNTPATAITHTSVNNLYFFTSTTLTTAATGMHVMMTFSDAAFKGAYVNANTYTWHPTTAVGVGTASDFVSVPTPGFIQSTTAWNA